MREQIELLEHHADVAAHFVDLLHVIGELDTVDDDTPPLVWFQPVDAPYQGRLAGARWATDHDPLASHHRQVEVAQDVEISEPLVDTLHLNVKHGSDL